MAERNQYQDNVDAYIAGDARAFDDLPPETANSLRQAVAMAGIGVEVLRTRGAASGTFIHPTREERQVSQGRRFVRALFSRLKLSGF